MDIPKEQERLRKLFDSEVDEACTLRRQALEMEEEVETATQVDIHDTDHLKTEQANLTADLTLIAAKCNEMTEAESGLGARVGEMRQEFDDTEDEIMQREREVRDFGQRAQ